jgi:hypothetical protein
MQVSQGVRVLVDVREVGWGWFREPVLHRLVLALLMMGFRTFGCAKWLGTFAGHPEHLAAARAFPVGQMHAIPNGR